MPLKLRNMFKLYLTLLLEFIKMYYVMSVGDIPEAIPSTSDTSEPIVLPLALIKVGKYFTNPTKIKEPISQPSGEPFTGNIEFLADSEGYQVLLCGAKPPTDETVTVSYFSPKNAYCNYPIKFKKSDTLKCAHEPEPILTKLTVPIGPLSFISNINCGPENKGTAFHFVYKICMTKEPIENEIYSSEDFHPEVDSIKYYDQFEIYRICIEESTMDVFFTEHRIMSPHLLNDQRLQQERKKKYNLRNAKNLGLKGGEFEERYRLMKIQTTNPSQRNLNSDKDSDEVLDITPAYTIQKFVPPNDFAFALWRKPTFDHFNVKKMEIEQIQLWDHLGELIRADAIKHNREYYIQTSAYKLILDLSSDKSKSNRKKTVTIWVKTVYHLPSEALQSNDLNNKNKAIAIFMDSDSQDDPQVDLELNERYGKNLCENTFTKKHIKGKSVRCCSIIDDTTYLNINRINIEEDLRIESLYDDNIDSNDDNLSSKKMYDNIGDIDSDNENQPSKKMKIILDLNLDANSLPEFANDS